MLVELYLLLFGLIWIVSVASAVLRPFGYRTGEAVNQVSAVLRPVGYETGEIRTRFGD